MNQFSVLTASAAALWSALPKAADHRMRRMGGLKDVLESRILPLVPRAQRRPPAHRSSTPTSCCVESITDVATRLNLLPHEQKWLEQWVERRTQAQVEDQLEQVSLLLRQLAADLRREALEGPAECTAGLERASAFANDLGDAVLDVGLDDQLDGFDGRRHV